MAFNADGDLSDTIDKAKVYVIVDDTVVPVEVKTTGIYNIEMYSEDFKVGNYVVGTSNNKSKDIIAVATPIKDTWVHDDIVGRIIGKVENNIAKVLI
jgi:hypothetical protein|tara:strand:+ start:122 stop:412 length:291 start_codon:yes stop_codon:yes gene_type:complete